MTDQHFPLMIPEATCEGKSIEVIAPYDGMPLATVETTDSKAANVAMTTANRLYKERNTWLPADQRIHILERTATIMREQAEVLALGSAQEGGKPLIDSRVEVARAIDGIKLCAEGLRTQAGKEIPMRLNAASMHRLAFTHFEPIGPVVAVSAFNHPLNLIVHQVGPAVAAGCPVVVKPANDTALSCLRFVKILQDAGLPKEWCQVAVTEGREVAEQLVTDQRVNFFSFIGSAKVGWHLRSKLSPGTRCALEHGGVAPVIVAPDADLEDVVPLLVKGGFYHAGQVCVSVQRIFVHDSIAKDFSQRIANAAGKLVVGDPTNETTDVGPLIRNSEVDRIEEWIADARSGGAQVLAGGKRISNSCYSCTVLYAPTDDAIISRNEVFGPVVCIYPYSELDDAISKANDLPYAFQAAVCTQDINTALRCYQRLDASAVMVNDHTAFRVDWMPFSGLRESGHGIGGIHHTLHEMQFEKMMVIRSNEL